MGKTRKTNYSESMRVAIGFMMGILHRRFLSPPKWGKHFTFFESILPETISLGEIVEDRQMLSRKIRFFGHSNSLMAEVWLDGYQSTSPRRTFWEVTKVRYQRVGRDDEHIEYEESAEWYEWER